MSLETIIPPEIIDDELAQWLTKLAARPDVKTILEIGSSSGEGSTQAIVNGMLEAEHDQELFCVEMSKTRFEALKTRYASLPFVHCFQGSSVPLDGYMTSAAVRAFYRDHHTNLNKYSLGQVLGWLDQDVKALMECPDRNLIRTIKDGFGETIDMAVLDGSAFTGYAELQEVYGAKIIVLDDVNDIKHFKSSEFLANDRNYRLLANNATLRNGYTIYERVT